MEKKEISLGYSLLPVAFLAIFVFYSVQIAGIDVHVPIFLSGLFAAIIAKVKGKMGWNDLEKGIVDTIKMAIGAIIVLLIIGMVIGTWVTSGIVPTMIYYGLKLINPRLFLVTALLICSIVSVSTGSSWTAASTVGVALMGIGEGFGIDRNIIAGAVISGAFFGDKMSPLSDTTNLAPMIAGSNLFEHIKHMFYTTVPAYIISMILFFIMGMRQKEAVINSENINRILETLSNNFVITPYLLLIPVVVIIIVIMKIPAIPGLAAGAILGGVVAIVVQKTKFSVVIKSLHYGYNNKSGYEMVDKLLNRGGLNSMLWTISLIICALIFAGIMERSGMLEVITRSIIKFATTTGKLILGTLLTSTFINLFIGEQYMSIVIPGRMYKDIYKKRGLAPKNLSRCLEDAGTLTAALVPWNTCGAAMMVFLDVPAWSYVPFCFLCILNPIISAIYGFTGYSIEKENKKDIEIEGEIA